MRKLEERVEIAASRQAVWDAMASFGTAATWASRMRFSSLKGERINGVGTHRILLHTWGFHIEEIVTQWADGDGFSFDVVKAPFPMCNVCETWVLKPDDVRPLLTVTVSYEMRLGWIGALLDTVLVRFIVAREMRLSMRGFKQHIESRNAYTKPVAQMAQAAVDTVVSEDSAATD